MENVLKLYRPRLSEEKEEKEWILTRPKLLCILDEVDNTKTEIRVVHDVGWNGKKRLEITGKSWDQGNTKYVSRPTPASRRGGKENREISAENSVSGECQMAV